MLKGLNLELGDGKTFVNCINSGDISFLGYRYLEGIRGKEIAAEKISKFKGKIRHLTSVQHIDSFKKTSDCDLIHEIIPAINRRIRRTRKSPKAQAKQGNAAGSAAPKLSPHSFPVHYSHNREKAIFKQMGKLDSFIRWRVARCLTDPEVADNECHRKFFGEILPEYNRIAREVGKKPVNLLPLTGLFNNIPAIRSAGSYGLEN